MDIPIIPDGVDERRLCDDEPRLESALKLLDYQTGPILAVIVIWNICGGLKPNMMNPWMISRMGVSATGIEEE